MPPKLSIDAQLEHLASGATPYKYAARVVATSAVDFAGLDTIGGVALAEGDRVLVAVGSSITNGLWVASSGAWYRPEDFSSDLYVKIGTLVPVLEGVSAGLWLMTVPTTGRPRLGVTALTFDRIDVDISLSEDEPLDLAEVASAGVSGDAARADHQHALPNEATTSTAGLMSATDKATLDAIVGPGFVPVQASGDTTGATDADRWQDLLDAGVEIRPTPGAVYWFDRPLVLSSESRIINDSPKRAYGLIGSAFVAEGAGAADDPANCMVRGASTLAGADETTLSAAFRRMRRSFTTTAPLSSPVGKTYRLRSIGTASGGVGTLDTDIEISELVTVESGSGPYIIDRGAGAPHGAHVDASNTTQVREVTTVVRDVVIRGMRFQSSTTVGGAATQIACAVYLQHVIGADVDVEGFGFSRSIVEARFCRDSQFRAVDRGTCNGAMWERSCQDSRIRVERPAGGARFHANGIPRATLYVDYMSAGGVYDCDVTGGVVGAEFVGYIDAQAPSIRAIDCDTTERVSRDAVRLPDIGGSQGVAGGLTIRAILTGTTFDETPYGMAMGDVYLSQCGGPGADGQQPSMLCINTKGLFIDSLTIENKGSDVSVTTPNRVGGAMFYDSYTATVNYYETNGIENALLVFGNFNAVHIGTWRWDPAHAFSTAQNAIAWGMQGDGTVPPCTVHIGKMVCADIPTRLTVNQGGVTGISDLSRDSITIGDLIVENVSAQGANYGRCKVYRAGNGYTPSTGEIAEVIPPQVVTFANATDVWSCVGHGLANDTAVYVRAQPNGAGVLPTGYSATTVYWVVNRAADTFQLSLTKGGAAYTGGSTDGTGPLDVTTAIPGIRQPTSGPAAAYRHVVVVNGSGFGSGASPTGYYVCSSGPMVMVRTDDVAHPGDLLEVAASTGVANNDLASADPYAIVEAFKTSAAAGVVQCRRV